MFVTMTREILLNLILYWYGQLVGHQPYAIYLCVSLCVCGHDPILLRA